MRLPRTEYDFVASLGGNCSAASQLKHRGKRPYSLPLDWTLMLDDAPVRWLPHGIRTRFADFCLRENLEEYSPPAMDRGRMTYHYLDRATGFRFIHHFHGSVADGSEYRRVKDTLDRRIRRLYAKAAEADNALFVLATAFPCDIAHLRAIHAALREAFPSACIDMISMQFKAGECSESTLEDGHLLVMRRERPADTVYDNQFTAPEWMWMDSIRIRCLPPPDERRKKSLLAKWKYKLWMALGRSLERDGFGCANMRFREFGECGRE